MLQGIDARWMMLETKYVIDNARMAQNAPKKREKAAQLTAEDYLSDEKIAAKCGISRRTSRVERRSAVYGAREEISIAYAERALQHGVARKSAGRRPG